MKIVIPERIVEVTFKQYVGERIKKRRTQLGLTMDDVVDITPITKAFLSDVENGKRGIGFEKLYYLATTLGRTTDWFAKGWSDE